jgi:hypothetical protein
MLGHNQSLATSFLHTFLFVQKAVFCYVTSHLETMVFSMDPPIEARSKAAIHPPHYVT